MNIRCQLGSVKDKLIGKRQGHMEESSEELIEIEKEIRRMSCW